MKIPQPSQKKINTCSGEKEGKLCFNFPKNWIVTKYDKWKFVNNRVSGKHLGFNGIKDKDIQSVDFACINEKNDTLWLIEVKDFRQGDGHGGLWDTLCNKFLFSMSGLFAARYAAENQDEKNFATKLVATDKLRFVLHLELPDGSDKWGKSCIDPADIVMLMEQKFSRVTPNPLVASINNMQNLPWSVTDLSA